MTNVISFDKKKIEAGNEQASSMFSTLLNMDEFIMVGVNADGETTMITTADTLTEQVGMLEQAKFDVQYTEWQDEE